MRYRLPPGSVPPLTDVIGELVQTGPTLRVRTKSGEVVAIAADDVVVIKELSAAPLRTSDIRNLEHAAALGWPGVEWQWQDGWLLRFGHGRSRRANSAIPLSVSAGTDLGPIVDWYAVRGLPALVAVPDRLMRVPAGAPVDGENLVMASDVTSVAEADASVLLSARPRGDWLDVYQRDIPIDVLSAVIDGDVIFGVIPGAAVGRAAVTTAPDGTRWVGLAAVHVADDARRRGHARTLCTALLAWGAELGATRAYTQVLVENTSATRLFESIGFAVHHRSRYVRADALQKGGGS